MKKESRTQMRRLGLAAAIVCCFALVGCGGNKKGQESEPVGAEEGVGGSQEDLREQQAEEVEPEAAQAEEEDQRENEASNGGQEDSGTQEILEGTIHKLEEGRFTMVKAIVEESEEGAAIISTPAGEDTEGFDLVEVGYGEDTAFERQTIWDGGARSETAAASMEALEKGQSVKVWGAYDESGTLRASKVCIIEVELE